MKDKYTIQRNWETVWLNDLATTQGWTDDYKSRVREAMGTEIDWAIRNPSFQTDLAIRIAKVTDQLVIYEGDLSSFDVYWQWRLDLWNWMMA